jgi:hypothetical protein
MSNSDCRQRRLIFEICQKSSPPIVQKLYVGKKIAIVGGVYDLATGKIALV